MGERIAFPLPDEQLYEQPPVINTDREQVVGPIHTREQRLWAFHRSPFGKMSTALATAMVLAADHSGSASYTFIENPDKEPGISRSIVADGAHDLSLKVENKGGSAADIHLADWSRMTPISSLPGSAPIQPNEVLKEMITKNEPLTDEIGLTPANIEHRDAFSQWVAGQANRSDLKELLGIQSGQKLTSRQIVDLAGAVVIANADYDTRHDATTPYYKVPLDVTLMNNGQGILQCEGFASATVAVFNVLKEIYPDELKNTYMTTQSGIEEGHVWDLVTELVGPSEASMAFLDPTAADPSYKNEPVDDLNDVTKLLEGLVTKEIIDGETFFRLAEQYNQQKTLTPGQKSDFQEDRMYVQGVNLSPEDDKKIEELLNQ